MAKGYGLAASASAISYINYIPRMSPTSSSAASTSDRLTTVLSYGALLLLIYLVFRMVEPFLEPLAWSGVLAIIFYPAHKRIMRWLQPNRAAVVSTVGVTVLLIAPALVVLVYTARQALDATAQLQATLMDPEKGLPTHALAWIKQQLPQAWQGTDFSEPLRQGAERIASFLASRLAGLVKNLFNFFVDWFIVIFALFFMFRDGDEIVRGAGHLLPFDEAIQEEMLRESRDLIFASVAVALVIAVLQGVLGGLAFTVGGISSPIFWAVLIAFFSLVPVVGSALIWAPAALFLAFSGHWGKGLAVVVICGGVAGVGGHIIVPGRCGGPPPLVGFFLFLRVV